MQNRTLIETRKQILQEITEEHDNSGTTTRLDAIRAGNDEALKSYLSETRVNILRRSIDSLSAFIETDNLIERLDLLDDAGIKAYDNDFFETYNAQINAGLAAAEASRNAYLEKIEERLSQEQATHNLTAAFNSSTIAGLINSTIPAAIAAGVSTITAGIGNAVVNLIEAPAAVEQTPATNSGTDYLGWIKLIGVGAFVLTLVVYRHDVAANVKYCKEKLSHTLFGGYDTIPTTQDLDEEQALLSTVNPSLNP